MKVVSSLLALALAGVGYGLDFYSRAARLPVLMKQVETATSRTLRVDDELRNEVLYINVKGVEEQALLDLIAEAADAKWRTTSSSMVLEPDVAKRRRQAEAELNALRDAFLADFELVANSESRDPVGAEINKLLRQISLQDLGRSIPNRVVYSSSPIESQLPLPGPVDKLVSLLMRDIVLTESGQREIYGDFKLINEIFSEYLNKIGRRAILEPQASPDTQPARVLLVVRFGIGPAALSNIVDVVIENKAGQVLVSYSYEVGIEAYITRRARERAGGSAEAVLGSDSSNGTPIVYRGESKQLIALKYARDSDDRTAFPEEIRAWLTRPDEYELLGFLLSDAWDSWCTFFNSSVVVNVEDQFPMRPDSTRAPTMSIESFDKLVRSKNSFASLFGVNIVKPSFPAESRQIRMDRVLMRSYIDGAESNGGLAEVGSLAALVDSELFQSQRSLLSDFYERQVGPQAPFIRTDESTYGLALWNRLTESQRRTIREGGELPLSQLRPSAKELIFNIHTIVPEMVVKYERPAAPLDQWIFEAVRGEIHPRWWQSTDSDFQFEPTDFWGEIVSGQGEVRSTTRKEALIVKVDSFGVPVKESDNYTLSEFVWDSTMLSLGLHSIVLTEATSFYKIGEIEIIDLQIVVTPEWMIPCVVEIVRLDPNSQVLTLDQVKTQLREGIERLQGEMESSGLMTYLRRKKAERGFDPDAEPPVLN